MDPAALYASLGLTERDMQRIRDMVDEAARRSGGSPGPITALIDLDAEKRVFCHPPGKDPPYDGAYIGTRQGWRIYAAELTNSDRKERKRVLGG